jgi:sugar lactone lactonase YvrE
VISTFAGGAPPPTPVLGVNMSIGTVVQSVAADALGNTYFVAFLCVFKLDQNGMVTRIAGNGRPGYSGDGGPAISAQFMLDRFYVAGNGPLPPGIAVDTGGNIYVADNGNSRIRRISPDGIITTIAGNGTFGFSGDGGPATSAELSSVAGLAVDVAGNLWIADSAANRIRRVTPDGNIATVAGTGDCGFSGDGGPAAAAQLCGPAGIAADAAGNLFIADLINNRIRQVTPDGTITTVASQFEPTNVAVDQTGNLLVAETYDSDWSSFQVVSKISPSGDTTVVVGFDCWAVFGADHPCAPVPGDGTTATKTYLNGPIGLAADGAGNLVVADGDRRRILKVSSDGAITTVAGNGENGFSGDGGPATSAQLGPWGVAVDRARNVFIADYGNDRIRRVAPDGIITTVAGNGTYGSSGDGGPATMAQVEPISVTVDGVGNLFFFDLDRSIRKVSVDGIVTTVALLSVGEYFVGADTAGDLFTECPAGFGTYLYTVCEISPDGTIRRVAGNGTYGFSGDGGPATSAQLSYTYSGGVALDSAGNLFIADSPNNRIRKVTPDGTITSIAGSGPTNPTGRSPGGFSGDGGPATSAQLAGPEAVAADDAGNVFIADSGNGRIREVSPDGIIRTIAGDGTFGYSGDGGPAVRASFLGPIALAVDGGGNIYVSDGIAIRILRPVPVPVEGPGSERRNAR